MRPQLRISGRPAFRGGQLPFPGGFEQLSDRLLRDIELVDIEIPGGILTRDRTQFTPIQEAHYQASQHMKRKDWPRAIEAIRKVIELGPEPPLLSALYTMMGMAHASARNQDAAIEAFRKAIEINENAEFAHLFLGTSLMLLDRFEEAIGPLQKALELDPSLTHVNFYLGHVYAKLGRWDDAIAAYNTEIETHRQSPEAYQELAKLYIRLGDENPAERERHYLKAIEAYKKWTEVSPGDSATYNFIGYLYSMLGQLNPAIEAYEKAIEAQPNNVIALSNLGTAYLATNRDREAKEIFARLTSSGEEAMREQLAKLSSNLEEAVRLSMAEAYQKLGAASLQMYLAQGADERDRSLLAEAEAAFKASLDYLPEDIHSLYNLGVTYYMTGRRVAAIKIFRQVLEIDPNNEDASNNLRATEEEMGKARHWLGSKVWRLLEKSSEQTPVYSQDLVEEIAEGRARIYEGIDAGNEDDAFTSDDLLEALLPLMEYIPPVEARADLAARVFIRGWLTPAQATRLVGADLAAFLGYLHSIGVSLSGIVEYYKGGEQDYADASIEALKKVLELRADDERARDELRTLMEQRLDERLRESGLLKEIRMPITDFGPYHDRTLLTAGNKPLSEIVIEGRR